MEKALEKTAYRKEKSGVEGFIRRFGLISEQHLGPGQKHAGATAGRHYSAIRYRTYETEYFVGNPPTGTAVPGTTLFESCNMKVALSYCKAEGKLVLGTVVRTFFARIFMI